MPRRITPQQGDMASSLRHPLVHFAEFSVRSWVNRSATVLDGRISAEGTLSVRWADPNGHLSLSNARYACARVIGAAIFRQDHAGPETWPRRHDDVDVVETRPVVRMRRNSWAAELMRISEAVDLREHDDPLIGTAAASIEASAILMLRAQAVVAKSAATETDCGLEPRGVAEIIRQNLSPCDRACRVHGAFGHPMAAQTRRADSMSVHCRVGTSEMKHLCAAARACRLRAVTRWHCAQK